MTPRPDPEPLARETRQFVENAFVFPVDVGVADRIQPIIQNPYGAAPGTTPDLPERRRVTGVTLEITPEYMPAAATLVVQAEINSPATRRPAPVEARIHFVRIDENSLRYCVTALDEPTPEFTQETIDTWAWATDTLTIGLRADPVPGDDPKTAVRVPNLREILSATETLTVQRTEGFFGSYTITAPSFTVVGNAYFFPLTPLQPPEEVLRAIRSTSPGRAAGTDATEPAASADLGVGVDLGDAPGDSSRSVPSERPPSDGERLADDDTQRPFMSPQAIAHAYPHYDVEKGAFPDPLNV